MKKKRKPERTEDKNQIAGLVPNISIVTLHINHLNISNKRQSLKEWIINHDSSVCCLQGTQFKYNDIGRLTVNSWKKKYHTNINQKKRVVAMLLDNVHFRTKKTNKDRKPHCIMT